MTICLQNAYYFHKLTSIRASCCYMQNYATKSRFPLSAEFTGFIKQSRQCALGAVTLGEREKGDALEMYSLIRVFPLKLSDKGAPVEKRERRVQTTPSCENSWEGKKTFHCCFPLANPSRWGRKGQGEVGQCAC